MPAGRPTKYDPSICADVPGLFENGESVAEVCVALGISKQAYYDWQEKYPEFYDAVHEGLKRSEAWWTMMGRSYLVQHHQGARLDTGLWKSNMANRFGWREKQDVTSDDKPLMPNVTVSIVDPSTPDDS